MLVGSLCYAGEDVAASWTSLTIKKNFNHGLGLALRGEYRTTDNISTTDLFFVRLTGSYKVCPYLSMSLAYDYFGQPQAPKALDGIDYQGYLKHNHRLLLDLMPMYADGNWTFSLRERYVFAYGMPATVVSVDDQLTTQLLPYTLGHVLRTMPQVKYHISETDWSPYMAVEFYNSIKPGAHFALSQMHLFAGVNWKINDVNSFNFCYVLQHRFPADKRLHSIDIEYIITLP